MSNYYEIDRFSYSQLASFDRLGLKYFTRSNDANNDAVRIGSLVDDILTDPKSVKDKYYLTTAEKPTSSLGLLTDVVTDAFADYDSIDTNTVSNLARALGLWSNIKKDDTYIKKFDNPKFWDYLKSFYDRGDRLLITVGQQQLAQQMSETLINDIDTKDAFIGGEGVEVIYQQEMLWGKGQPDDSAIFGDEPFKGYKSKFDILRVDHNNMTVQFVDIKTSEASADEFERSFYMFRYYIQDAMYQDALAELRDTTYPGYTLLDPYNIVCSSAEPDKAYKFVIDSKWLSAGKHGFMLGRKPMRGYLELTQQVEWHQRTKVTNYTKTEFDNGRVKSIDFFGTLE